jgi:hypothetical protein
MAGTRGRHCDTPLGMHVRTAIQIAAPRAQVWAILADFADYDRWNPMCQAMQGECIEGSRLRFKLALGPVRPPITVDVTTVVAERELRWTGPTSGLARRIASGEHFFVLHDRDGGTYLEHGEVFRGALGVGRWLGGEKLLAPSYEALNRALKAEAETRLAASA